MKQINRKSLESALDLDKVKEEIQEMKETLDEISDIEELDTNEILQKNIERANYFLDKIQEEVENGSMSGPLMAAASSLIGVITTTASSYISNSINLETLDVKKGTLSIKEQELELKKMIAEAKKGESPQPQQVNISQTNIMASREEIMKMLSAPTGENIINLPKMEEKVK